MQQMFGKENSNNTIRTMDLLTYSCFIRSLYFSKFYSSLGCKTSNFEKRNLVNVPSEYLRMMLGRTS